MGGAQWCQRTERGVHTFYFILFYVIMACGHGDTTLLPCRHERECTHGMRQALEEITCMLQDLPSPEQRRQKHRQAAIAVEPQQQLPQQPPQPHTVNVPVTISMSGDKHRAASPPPSPGAVAHDPNGELTGC
jgi:hypothetical protein